MEQIATYKELTDFIQKEWDSISPDEFTAIISTTIGLYLDKPNSLVWALKRIDEYYQEYKIVPLSERPLFLKES